MQDQVNNGGPAFPVSENYDERRGETITYASEGMSLRDYFAAKAMAALTQALVGRSGSIGDWVPAELAYLAYQQADDMLLARGAQ